MEFEFKVEKIQAIKNLIDKRFGLLGGIVIAMFALIIGVTIYNTPTNRLSRQLNLGNRYLEEQNYEQAIVEFDKAIAIDPMSVEAYLGKEQAYIGMDDIDMAMQTLEDGLNRTGDEQIKGMLTDCYLNWANELVAETDYDKALEIYDRLLELDEENEIVQFDVGNCLEGYLNLLIEKGNYDEARLLIEKYQDKVSTVDFHEYLDRVEEAERFETEKIVFMQKVYDLMIAEDWEALRSLDEAEETGLLMERITDDRYLFFPDNNISQHRFGVGVYKDTTDHYFYVGDYVNSARSGNGTFFETNDYDGYDYFTGEWRDDAPNGQGKLTKNYYLSDRENLYYMVVEGNYTDGLCDGYMNCILTDNENGDFNLSYYAANGTPEDITDKVHKMDVLSWRDNYIYAYEENGNSISWNLHLNTNEDKLGVFGFESIHEQRWQDAYIGYINDKKHNWTYFDDTNMYLYRLVDINNDDIPELYIDYGTTASGSVLCSFYEGSIIEQWLWTYGLSYIEGENLFMDSGGHMDFYYNKVYCISDGEFVLLYEGEYGAPDNSHVQYDSEGNPLYNYYWRGTQIPSKAEYSNLLNAVYDPQKSVNLYEGLTYDAEAGHLTGNSFCDYEEIIEVINSY